MWGTGDTSVEVFSCDNTTAPYLLFFFFQAEDGIRDLTVTGVQTCALPISARDQADLRAVGADNAFFAAIDECLRARAAARPGGRGGPLAGAAAAPKRRAGPAGTGGGGARGAPGGARGAALRIVGSPSVAADAGSDAAVTVRLLRGNAPLAGTLLLLTGSGAILGGSTEDARALTNARGVATFPIAAGTTPGPPPPSGGPPYRAPPPPG